MKRVTETTAQGRCLAAQVDEVLEALASVMQGEDARIVVRNPAGAWCVSAETLTDRSASLMPCGRDGTARSGRNVRERGCFVSGYDLLNNRREVERAAAKIIGRSTLIHAKEQTP